MKTRKLSTLYQLLIDKIPEKELELEGICVSIRDLFSNEWINIKERKALSSNLKRQKPSAKQYTEFVYTKFPYSKTPDPNGYWWPLKYGNVRMRKKFLEMLITRLIEMDN